MKYSLQIGSLSFTFIGKGLLVLAIASVIPFHAASTMITQLACAAVAVVLILCSRHYLVFLPADRITRKMGATLALLGLKADLVNGVLQVENPKSFIGILAIQNISIVSFRFRTNKPAVESYLTATLLKF